MYPSTFAFPLRPISCYSLQSSSCASSSSSTPPSSFTENPISTFPDFPERRRFRTYSEYFTIMGDDSDGPRRRLLSRAKFPRLTLDPEPRRPLVPVNNAADSASLQRSKSSSRIPFRNKGKDSAEPAKLRLDLDSDTSPPDSAGPNILTARANRHCLSSGGGFEPRDRFVYRRGLMHHPYPRDDAPYMQAYDRTLMDNDRFSELLLRRLNTNQSPSFLTFEQDPPRNILDLGCGQGQWAIDAAAYWPSALVIGFDLVHAMRLNDDAPAPPNLQWMQGNFLKYKLPFPKDSFDFVRMANLSLCIPHDRWEHVFHEVRRVLGPGGRLELIDDYIHFPYSKPISQRPHDMAKQNTSSFSADDDDKSSGAWGPAQDSDAESDDDFKSTKSRLSVLDPDSAIPYNPVADWDCQAQNAKNLEQIFETMLWRKFRIDPRPRERLQDTLQAVFGRYNLQRVKDFRLFLAPPSDKDSDKASVTSSDSGGAVKKAHKDFVQWVTNGEWDKGSRKNREKGDRSSGESSVSFSQIPELVSAKAAGRLGITSSPARSSPLRQAQPGQSPGLIVNLQTFIPLSPFELEMHACKHIHTLLGCKAVLHEHLADLAQETGHPVPEDVIDDLLWEYECFRRKRFHWPAEVPEYQLDMAVMESPRSASTRLPPEGGAWRQRSISNSQSPHKSSHGQNDLDLVRSIQVYCATKIDDDFHPLA